MLAVHLDNFLFLLLIGIAGLFRLLAKKINTTSNQDNQPPPARDLTPPTLPPQELQTDEERIRKFLEALGQPTSSKPPPPVKPRTAPPPLPEFQRPHLQDAERSARRRTVVNPLPPLTTFPQTEAPRRVTVPRQMPAARPESKTADAPIFEVQQAGRATPSPTAAGAVAGLPTVEDLVEAFTVATRSSTPAAAPKSDLAALLSTPGALRQAIILREIFGPPRSLQPFDLAGNA